MLFFIKGSEKMKTEDLVEEKFSISQKEMNFILNSGIRFKILSMLHESPLAMRDIKSISNFTYSAIVTHLDELEDHGLVEKDGHIYCLNKEFDDVFENILNLNRSMEFIKENKIFLNKHKIFNMNSDSLSDLSPLFDMELIVNDSDDIFKVSRLIEDFLTESKSIKSVFPYVPLKHDEILDNWIRNESSVNLILSEDVCHSLKNFICEYDFDGEIGDFELDVKIADPFLDVLLVISDKGVLLGFYNNGGEFDNNSIFMSRNKKIVEWALKAFETYEDSCGEHVRFDELLRKNKD